MDQKNTDKLVANLLSIFPLMNKKLFPPVQVFHDNELNHTHFFLLKIVEEFGPIRTSDLGKKLAIKKSNLTPLINKLIVKELVTREKAAEDRRVIFIKLTSKGGEFLANREEVLKEEIKGRLTRLQDSEADKLFEAVAQLEGILKKLNLD
ncbi:MarR family transcriptional regulator [Salipaludibacillus sp. CF4.18]|uniref:MarR family transcriptional regulator n=1 Tax=Salipaludibacillus sp. CF4.18 TaxID=3373081 RepID=UPI003EE5A68A